jgi:asparagine synthase (glutamine-hydrolysing)
MVAVQHHRGPDAQRVEVLGDGAAGLGHNRLSIIDLSDAGIQPMCDPSRRYWIVFNGELYNYLELRRELETERVFHTNTDTEVLLAAFERWHEACLDRLMGMFAFAIWDEVSRTLFAARDRFGVKPLYYANKPGGPLLIASEIKALFAAGVERTPSDSAWATYLASGIHDHGHETFWRGVNSVPPGHFLTWRAGQYTISSWYDLADRVGPEVDRRSLETVREEYKSLLEHSVRLRFRSDVPVGINLSGGLDSSTLLGLVHAVEGADSETRAFTFITGDDRYDELPWVTQMLARTNHPLTVCRLDAGEVPSLAESVQHHEDEPFGGLPTLAYAKLFEEARRSGVIVLLDGQGMDEQWCGYDYYQRPLRVALNRTVQGTREPPVRPNCLAPEFRDLAQPLAMRNSFEDPLWNLQYRDASYTKIPRALRFNDRVSMRASTELREPFLDHRLFELALRQPRERKIAGNANKWLERQIARQLLPDKLVEAPKRPLQTPQREWLRGQLRAWAQERIEHALHQYSGSWLDADMVRRELRVFNSGQSDNSFYVWQWISIGLMAADQFASSQAQRTGAYPVRNAADRCAPARAPISGPNS